MKYLLIILLFAGCYTAGKSKKDVNKAIDRYPAQTADLLRKTWPCVVQKADTVTNTLDSIITIECPDVDPVSTSPDTVYLKDGRAYVQKTDRYGKKTFQVSVKVPVTTYYITKNVEDSAKIEVLMAENAKLKKQLVTKTNINWGLIGLCVALAFVLFIFIKKKK